MPQCTKYIRLAHTAQGTLQRLQLIHSHHSTYALSMSYGQNQNRNTESWNNDPNNFSNPSGPDNSGAFEQQRGGFQDQSGTLRLIVISSSCWC